MEIIGGVIKFKNKLIILVLFLFLSIVSSSCVYAINSESINYSTTKGHLFENYSNNSVEKSDFILDSKGNLSIEKNTNNSINQTGTQNNTNISKTSKTPLVKGNKWALLIGISDYKYINDLDYPTIDALNMEKLLLNNCGFDKSKIITLLNGNATKMEIQNAIKNLKTLIGPSDSLIFYFSGHGGSAFNYYPYDEVDRQDEYICAYDASRYGISNRILDDELKSWLDNLNAYRIVCIFDSCCSGGMNDLNGTKYTVLSSCSEDELAGEDSYVKNGVFTHFLIEGFQKADTNKDLQVSVEEAFKYAAPLTTAYVKGEEGYIQIPEMFDGDTTREIELSKTLKDITSPVVLSVDPEYGYNVNTPIKIIKITLSEPVKKGTNRIELMNGMGTVPVKTIISGNTLIITPISPLINGKYTITLYADCVFDLSGNRLELWDSMFTVNITSKNAINTNIG